MKKENRRRTIVAGAGPVAQEVARQLQNRGELVRMIDLDPDRLDKARQSGFQVEKVNLQDDEELLSLGLDTEVDVFFSLLENDADNVFLVISIRALAPDLPIVSISESEDTVQRLTAAGATKVIDPYQISGYRIYEMVHRPVIAELMDRAVFGKGVDLEIAEIPVPAGSFVDGQYLDQLSLSSRYNLVVLGVVDRDYGDQLIFATNPKRHRIDVNDIIVVIGQEEELERLRRDVTRTGEQDRVGPVFTPPRRDR